MDEEQQKHYEDQLKAVFDGCDSTGTGFLDKEELSLLCQRLSLDAHRRLLLDTLLGPQHDARVNFEEFKEGFVAVLSRSLDLSTSEDDSSYLEPVLSDEVQPRFIRGGKRYGRRSHPDQAATPSATLSSAPPTGRWAKLRRSTSLESVESLKSDEDTGGSKEAKQPAAGQLKHWRHDSRGGLHHVGSSQEVTDGQVQAIWAELGVGLDGFLNREELSLVCQHIGLKDLQSEELGALFRRLDGDQDGRVSLMEFQLGLFRRSDLALPFSTSTPEPTPPSAHRWLSQAFEKRVLRSTSPTLCSTTVGTKLLSQLDDGSGSTSAEKLMALWSEEGIRNSADILQTLDFSLEECVGLAELTLALENELLTSGNEIHHAALVCYRSEIHWLQHEVGQVVQERDKVKASLEQAERRTLQLLREIDDRHATMESHTETKIKDIEQHYKDRLLVLRCESEQESEVLLQQAEQEVLSLRQEVKLLRTHEVRLQEEVHSTTQESRRLEAELGALRRKLSESENHASRLQNQRDQLLQDKFGNLDAGHTPTVSQEEHLIQRLQEYQLQCRELQDRNDELSFELELLKTQSSGQRSPNAAPEEHVLAPVSIGAELATEQLRQQHELEVQDLRIQLETKVSLYERQLGQQQEAEHSFRQEISQLEKQRACAEERAEQLQKEVERLALKDSVEGGAWGWEQERRVQRERADLEQNYAHEVGNIFQRLTTEKEQLEAELRLKMDQEVLVVRREAQQQLLQMKVQHTEVQRSLRSQLQQESSQLQEQAEHHNREVWRWEACMQELEQEVHREQVLRKVQQHEASSRLQAQTEKASMSLQRHLEERLEEMCTQLEENTYSLKARDALIQHLTAEVHAKDKDTELRKDPELKMLSKQFQLEQERKSDEDVRHEEKEQAQLLQGACGELQGALEQEQHKTTQLQLILESLQDDSRRLSQENISYARLSDQLSTQIGEMEGELSHLRGILKQREQCMQEQREELEARTREMEALWEEVQQKMEQQRAGPVCSEDQLEAHPELSLLGEEATSGPQLQEAFETEMSQMKEQLLQMEQLVMALENTVMMESSSDRAHLDALHSENAALTDRLAVLQSSVTRLEEEDCRKRKRLEELKRESGQSREQEQELQKQASQCREEVLELSGRCLQLSSENAKLSSALSAEQQASQTLSESLAQVRQRHEEAESAILQLREGDAQREQERREQQEHWGRERERLQRDLHAAARQLGHLAEVEAELSCVLDQRGRLEHEAEARSCRVQKLQEALGTLHEEAEQLTSQLSLACQGKQADALEITALQTSLGEAHSKVQQMESRLQEVKEEQHQEVSALQEENRSLDTHNQDLLHRLQTQEQEVQRLTHECVTLTNLQVELEAAAQQAKEQTLKVQLQHMHELQELREQKEAWPDGRQQLDLVQSRLTSQQQRIQQLEEQLHTQSQQASAQRHLQQEQYEQMMGHMQERAEELELKLKSLRLLLQEKVNQLKEQLQRSGQAAALLPLLYVENAQLMAALQETEERQKGAERKNLLLEEKVTALNKLLRRITPASLSA